VNSISQVAEARMPSLGSVLPRMEAGLVGVDDERGDAARALVRLAHGEQHDVLGHRAGGDPALLAVDDVAAIGLLHRAAAHGGGIGARLRLGQREGADFLALGDRAHVFLLLRFGAVGEDAVAEQRVVDRHDRRVRGVAGGDLDHGQHVGHRVHARAAVFGRDFDAHQAVLAQGADVLEGELAAAVEVFGAGGDLFARDAPRDVLDHQLLFGEAEIHETHSGSG
jgi:hypothetical protein